MLQRSQVAFVLGSTRNAECRELCALRTQTGCASVWGLRKRRVGMESGRLLESVNADNKRKVLA